MRYAWELIARGPDGEGSDGGSDPAAVVAAEGAAAGKTGDAVEAIGGEGGEGGESATAAQSQPSKGLLGRIGQLTREKRELEERLEAFRQAAAEGTSAPHEGSGFGPTPEQVNYEIDRRAREIASQQEWSRVTDKVWVEGLEKHSDWAPQLNNLALVLGNIPRGMTEAAIETGSPVDVMYHLAKNPEEAARIAMLSPTKQAVAIAKLGQNLAAPPAGRRISTAPPPIAPKAGGSGAAPAVGLDDPNMPMEEWVKQRNEQVKARRGRR